MKHNLRIQLLNKENQIEYICEIKEVGPHSRIFAKIIEKLSTFENGKLEIKILKEKRKNMKVGDIVISSNSAYQLRSGSSAYFHAIVVQEEPLILVSEEGDMRWSTITPDMLKVIGVAKPEQLKLCMKRLEK